MRSPRGFFAALVFLSLLPVAIVYQLFFTDGLEVVTHLVLGTGSVMIALAVFDFKTLNWVTGMGCLSAGTLGFIFLFQALALIVQNATLTYLAFQLLGQQLEKLLGLVLMFWFIALLFFDSRGKTRVFGAIVMLAVVILQIYSYILSYRGGAAAEELKLILLLMFIWLLLESAKKNYPVSPTHSQ